MTNASLHMASRNFANTIPLITSIKPKSACPTSREGSVRTASVATSDTTRKNRIPNNPSGREPKGLIGRCLHTPKRVPLSFDNILNRSLIIYGCINIVSYRKPIFLQRFLITRIALLVHHHGPHLFPYHPSLAFVHS